MLGHYLKTTLRNILRRKAFAAINIAGLALGLAACILIWLWMTDELGFDAHYPQADGIYRVLIHKQSAEQQLRSPMTPPALAAALRDELPEVRDSTRYSCFFGQVLLRHGERAFYESGGAYADPAFLRIFDIPLRRGDPQRALASPLSVILSRDLAEKYFPGEDPLGKIMRLENVRDLVVTGVMDDMPRNSHLSIDFLVPLTLMEEWGSDLSSWQPQFIYTYVLLEPQAAPESLAVKLAPLAVRIDAESPGRLTLQAVTDIHLQSDVSEDFYARTASRPLIFGLGLAGLLVLLIACFNYINLTTALGAQRYRELGIRKIVGGRHADLIRQLGAEVIMETLLAFGLALLLADLFLSVFGGIAGKSLAWTWDDGLFMGGLAALAVLTALLAAAYPALVLAGGDPLRVLAGHVGGANRKSTLRTALVIGQFAITICLLICTLIIHDQLQYIRNKDLGLARDQLVYVQGRPGLAGHYPRLKKELLARPDIAGVTAASNLLGGVPLTAENVDWEGMALDDNQALTGLFVEYDFLHTMGLELVDGRDFSRAFAADATRAFILNESAARLMGPQSPVGREIAMGDRRGTVIGVIRDYHYTSLHQPIRPLIVQIRPEFCTFLFIRLESANVPATLAAIRDAWDRHMPDFPCQYHFLNEAIGHRYRMEQDAARLMVQFTVLAVLLSGLGLLGLAAHVTRRRTREIGVRKVMGASVPSLVVRLTRDFTLWVVLANLIAWPAAYFCGQRFLSFYAYRISLQPLTFLLGAVLGLAVAWVAVVSQTVRASLANPVDTLRHE